LDEGQTVLFRIKRDFNKPDSDYGFLNLFYTDKKIPAASQGLITYSVGCCKKPIQNKLF